MSDAANSVECDLCGERVPRGRVSLAPAGLPYYPGGTICPKCHDEWNLCMSMTWVTYVKDKLLARRGEQPGEEH